VGTDGPFVFYGGRSYLIRASTGVGQPAGSAELASVLAREPRREKVELVLSPICRPLMNAGFKGVKRRGFSQRDAHADPRRGVKETERFFMNEKRTSNRMNDSKRKAFRLAGVPAGIVLVLAIAFAVSGQAGAGSARTAVAPANTSPPTISGTPQEGQTLTGDKGTWSGVPTSYSYFWTRCDNTGGSCSNISGATATTYTLSSADLGNTVRFKVDATNADGSTFASSVPSAVIASAAKPAPPMNTSPPTISGTPQESQKLTGTVGTWSGNPTSYNYFWTRCDKNGASCSNISGANALTYTLGSTDVGNTIRFKVQAIGAAGARTSASSAQTQVITSATPPSPQGSAISVDMVSLPERLIIDKVSFSPNPLRSHNAFVARFHVSDTRANSIQGALVYALGLPYNYAYNAPEVLTDSSGWATITMRPTTQLPLNPGGSLVIFVRARKPGDNLLAGVSTRRLVQEGVSR
jgi:hypothetical protein